MTALFGSFPESFYQAYQEVRPLEPDSGKDSHLQPVPPAQPPQPVWQRLLRAGDAYPESILEFTGQAEWSWIEK